MELLHIDDSDTLRQVQVVSGQGEAFDDKLGDNMNDNSLEIEETTVTQTANIQFLLNFPQLFMKIPALGTVFMLDQLVGSEKSVIADTAMKIGVIGQPSTYG
jgi:hypothetical protein